MRNADNKKVDMVYYCRFPIIGDVKLLGIPRYPGCDRPVRQSLLRVMNLSDNIYNLNIKLYL